MGVEDKGEKEQSFCPYCDGRIAELSFPVCQSCQVTVFYCPECRKPVPRDKRVCPDCGAEIRGDTT